MAAVLYDESPLLVHYLIRLLIEGSPVATRLFDRMAAGTERSSSNRGRTWVCTMPSGE